MLLEVVELANPAMELAELVEMLLEVVELADVVEDAVTAAALQARLRLLRRAGFTVTVAVAVGVLYPRTS